MSEIDFWEALAEGGNPIAKRNLEELRLTNDEQCTTNDEQCTTNDERRTTNDARCTLNKENQNGL